MILPIYAFGDPILRKVGRNITQDYPDLQPLIDNMFETMYHAPGVGLAAPQVGLDINLFIVDTAYVLQKNEDEENDESPEDDEFAGELGIKQVFINAVVEKEYGKKWAYNEGCLSIPGIREDVHRLDTVVISYDDQDFNRKTQEFTGFSARVIQHEYDHTKGILFTDKINPLKKRFLKNRLDNITKGNVKVAYKMSFPLKSKNSK